MLLMLTPFGVLIKGKCLKLMIFITFFRGTYVRAIVWQKKTSKLYVDFKKLLIMTQGTDVSDVPDSRETLTFHHPKVKGFDH